MMGPLGFFGICAIALGCWSLVAMQRRTFERRNAAGVEEFKSYWDMVFTQTFELFMWLYGVSSITAGIVFLAFQFFRRG